MTDTPTGEALILAVKPHGEGAALVRLLCPQRGQLHGLVKQARRQAATLQPFNTVRYQHWRRLSQQLGTFTLELTISRSGLLLTSPGKLALATYLAPLLVQLLPEEHPYPAIPGALAQLLAQPLDAMALAHFERLLLETVGYGLRLNDPVPCPHGSPLAYVSPTSGRSVPQAVAVGYETRLLPLPTCWGGAVAHGLPDATQALTLTGHFLQQACHGHTPQRPLTNRAALLAHLNHTHQALLPTAHAA